MALRIGENAQQVSTSTGAGNFDLTPNAAGSQMKDLAWSINLTEGSAKIPYFIQFGTHFETGIGTLTKGAVDTLSRDTIVDASGPNRIRLNFGEGQKLVSIGNAAWLFQDLINIDYPVVRLWSKSSTAIHTTQSTTFVDIPALTMTIAPRFPNSHIECTLFIARGEAILMTGTASVRQVEVRFWSEVHQAFSNIIPFGSIYNDNPASNNRVIHGGMELKSYFLVSSTELHEFRVQFRSADSNVEARLAHRQMVQFREIKNP